MADQPAPAASTTATTSLHLGRRLILLVLVIGLAAGGLAALRERVQAGSASRLVAVAKSDLPAYHLIGAGDLEERRLAPNRSTEALEREKIVGRYTRTKLVAGQPIVTGQLGPIVEGSRLAATVAVGFAANDANVLGGALQPGDLVDITLSTPSAGSGTTRPVFKAIPVLDVVPSTSAQRDGPGQGPRAFTVILALPQARQPEFASATALLQLARRL